MAKILRLRTQRRRLKTRASEMLRRGLRTLDELEALEEKEKLEREEAEKSAQAAMQVAATSNTPFVPLTEEELRAIGVSPSWLFSSGDTPPPSVGN